MSKIVICAIAKNENLYLRDWVEYHKLLGIDRIYLYDNNDINGEKFDDVIKDYIDSRFVIVFDRRGIEKGQVYDKDDINLLNKCYIETYNNLKDYSDYLWVFFIDIDEYIYIKEGQIEEYLNSEKFKDYDTIVFPWVIYNDNNKLTYEPGKMSERFPHKSNYISDTILVKCCVRISKNIKSYKLHLLLHFMILNGEKVCYESGNPVNWLYPIINIDNNKKEKIKTIGYPVQEINNCNIVINHYRYKTLEEYLLRLFKRHWGTTKYYTNRILSFNTVISNFFKYNTKTKEKENIIKKIKKFIEQGRFIVMIYYKNDTQLYKILDDIIRQSYKPTIILIHIKDKKLKSLINLSNYKELNIMFYYNTKNAIYSTNKLIKVNELKYKIIMDEYTNYDDLFLKNNLIKELFK